MRVGEAESLEPSEPSGPRRLFARVCGLGGPPSLLSSRRPPRPVCEWRAIRGLSASRWSSGPRDCRSCAGPRARGATPIQPRGSLSCSQSRLRGRRGLRALCRSAVGTMWTDLMPPPPLPPHSGTAPVRLRLRLMGRRKVACAQANARCVARGMNRRLCGAKQVGFAASFGESCQSHQSEALGALADEGGTSSRRHGGVARSSARALARRRQRVGVTIPLIASVAPFVQSIPASPGAPRRPLSRRGRRTESGASTPCRWTGARVSVRIAKQCGATTSRSSACPGCCAWRPPRTHREGRPSASEDQLGHAIQLRRASLACPPPHPLRATPIQLGAFRVAHDRGLVDWHVTVARY